MPLIRTLGQAHLWAHTLLTTEHVPTAEALLAPLAADRDALRAALAAAVADDAPVTLGPPPEQAALLVALTSACADGAAHLAHLRTQATTG